MAEDDTYINDEHDTAAPSDIPTVEEFLHGGAKSSRRSSRPRIEFENEGSTTQNSTPTPTHDYVAEASDAVRRAAKSPSSFFDELFPGNGNAVLFGIIGLVAAILLFWVGLWRALVVVVLIVLGISYGQYLDGKPNIINSIKKVIVQLIDRRNNK